MLKFCKAVVRHAIQVAVITGVTSATALGQTMTIACTIGEKPGCAGTIPPEDSVQFVRITLKASSSAGTFNNALVRVRATSGVVFPDTTRTDGAGDAHFSWSRDKGSKDPAYLTVDVRQGSTSNVEHISLTPTAAKPQSIVLRKEGGFLQSWYEKGGPLPSAVEVELLYAASSPNGEPSRIKDVDVCTGLRVAFNKRGPSSSTSPDTATASLYTFKHKAILDSGCFAWTYWTLGEGFGDRTLSVNLVPKDGFKSPNGLEADGWVRAAPKFFTGFAYPKLRAYDGLNPASKRTVHVEITDSAAGTKHTYDSTGATGAASVDHIDGRREPSVVAGFAFPIPIPTLSRFDGLTLSLGVDLANPKDRFYAGVSVARWLGGAIWAPFEGIPVDVHYMAFWARQPELENAACAPVSSCKVKPRTRLQYGEWVFIADATSLVDAIVKKLAP